MIVQDDRFDATKSVTVCAFATDPTEAPLIRLPVTPDEENGLHEPCSLMVDKITTMPRVKIGARIGRLSGPGHGEAGPRRGCFPRPRGQLILRQDRQQLQSAQPERGADLGTVRSRQRVPDM